MVLIMGIGVPGCGKTTFIKPLAEESDLPYISSDDIRERLTGDANNHTKEREVWATLYREVAAALRQKGAVVDATFTSRKDRKGLIRIAKKHGVENITAYWFDVPIEVCLKRNSLRQRVVPEEVIRKMHDRLAQQPPSLEEGFAEIVQVRAEN